MKIISIGKLRGLAQVSSEKATFSILALDHRNNLRNAINPNNPSSVSNDTLASLKIKIVQAIAPYTSGVLLDPEVGAFQCIAYNALPGDKGLICAIEETGYTGNPISRISNILPGWSVSKAKRMGASAIKLLVYYHPKSDSAPEIESLIQQVGEDCQQNDMPFFLEPLSYSLVKGERLSSAERRDVVLETASRLSNINGVDVLKAEFPIDIGYISSEIEWEKACSELSEASKTPWILLSASVEFETYLRQVNIACQTGCSGVAAGRAVWKEAVTDNEIQQTDFLNNQAIKRMQALREVCDSCAKPWSVFFGSEKPDSTFFRSY